MSSRTAREVPPNLCTRHPACLFASRSRRSARSPDSRLVAALGVGHSVAVRRRWRNDGCAV